MKANPYKVITIFFRWLQQNTGVHWGVCAKLAHVLELSPPSFLEFSQTVILIGKTL